MAKQGDGRVTIEISLSNDGEAAEVFVGGCPEGDFRIKRGVPVRVPQSVLDRLDMAILGVPEVDPDDPTKTRFIERKRFAYTILQPA
jgi:hypothetical protein